MQSPSLYARGMTTREIQGHLEEIYQVEVSPTLISNVTDAVIEEVRAWETRPLDAIYPAAYRSVTQSFWAGSKFSGTR
jgi:putative transposase